MGIVRLTLSMAQSVVSQFRLLHSHSFLSVFVGPALVSAAHCNHQSSSVDSLPRHGTLTCFFTSSHAMHSPSVFQRRAQRTPWKRPGLSARAAWLHRSPAGASVLRSPLCSRGECVALHCAGQAQRYSQALMKQCGLCTGSALWCQRCSQVLLLPSESGVVPLRYGTSLCRTESGSLSCSCSKSRK